MHLKKIVLDKFKRHNHLEREFVPGVNVVKGHYNEAGKSTLMDGIIAALFYRPDSADKKLDKYSAWNSGDDRGYSTSIEFQQGENNYRLDKDFRARSTTLTINQTETYKNYKITVEYMKDVFGIYSEKDPEQLYFSTACIKQDDVVAINLGMKEMGPVLEQVVMTGNAERMTASRLVPKLEKNIASLKKEIKENETATRQLSQRLPEINEVVERSERLKLEQIESENKLAVAKGKYQEANILLEKNKRRKEIEGTIKTLEEQFKALDELEREITDLQQKREESDRNLRSLQGFEDKKVVDEVSSGIEEGEIKRKTITGDLANLRKELVVSEENLSKHWDSRFGANVFLSVALVIIVLSVVAAVFINLFSLLGLVAAVVIFVRNSALVKERTRFEEFRTRIKKMENGLRDSNVEEARLLEKVKCKSVTDFISKKNKYEGYLKDRDIWENQLQGKLGKKILDSVIMERGNISLKLAVKTAELTDDLKNTRISPEKYIIIESEVGRLESETKNLEKRIAEDSASIKAARFDVEQKNSCDEQLSNYEEKNISLQHRLRVNEMVRELVMQARNNVLQSPSGTLALAKEAQNYLSIFTGGKYNKVRLPNNPVKQELEFEIFSEEKKDWVSPDNLSKGTIDEAYLACRLALVKLIYGDKRPPLILDDPFVNFDDVRLAKTLNFIKELAKEYQIIIFTLRDTFDEIADNIVSLEGN